MYTTSSCTKNATLLPISIVSLFAISLNCFYVSFLVQIILLALHAYCFIFVLMYNNHQIRLI
jgi:hypothetical protein